MDVSIIITAYNEVEYVSTAIESALNQTKRPNEVVIVDAGSTDGTRSIISNYEADNPILNPIFIDKEVNIPEMRNFALEKATGPLVTFLDGDDKFYPEKLQKEHDKYVSHPQSKIVFSNVENIDSDGNTLNTWFKYERPPTGDVLAENAGRNWPTGSLYRNELVSLELLHDVGMYDTNLIVYEDWDLKIRTAAETTVAYCSEVLTQYRQHGSGISSRISNLELRDASEYIYNKNRDLLEERLDEQQFKDVTRSMEIHSLEHSIHANKQEHNYPQLLNEYYQWLKKSKKDKYIVKKNASLILPERIKKFLR